MRRLGCILLLWMIATQAYAAERQVVLVVGVDSPVKQVSPIDVRKLFLALPVFQGGRQLRPIGNASDSQISQIFLQHIVAMSQSAYERRILTQVLQQGRPRPPQLESKEQVMAALYTDVQAVSYMWLHDVADNPRIRVVRVLWTE